MSVAPIRPDISDIEGEVIEPGPMHSSLVVAVLTAVAAVFFALGWCAAVVWQPLAWCWAAVREGWDAAHGRGEG